jgi:hypothetical protein
MAGPLRYPQILLRFTAQNFAIAANVRRNFRLGFLRKKDRKTGTRKTGRTSCAARKGRANAG